MLAKLIHFTSENAPSTLNESKIIRTILERPEYNHIKMEHYDIENDDAQELIMEYRIKSIPNTIFLDENGDFIRKITGKASEKDYKTYFDFDLRK